MLAWFYLVTPSKGGKPPMENYVEKKDHPENIYTPPTSGWYYH